MYSTEISTIMIPKYKKNLIVEKKNIISFYRTFSQILKGKKLSELKMICGNLTNNQNWWWKKYKRYKNNLITAMIIMHKKMDKRAVVKGFTKLHRPKVMWSDKYKPKQSTDILYHQHIVNSFRDWLGKWSMTGTRGILFSGPPGVGKTTLAKIVSEELGFEVFEIKPSVFRCTSKFGERIKNAPSLISEIFTNQTILLGRKKKKILMVDNLDCFESSMIRKINVEILKTQAPIILICCNKYNKKITTLRNRCYELNFQRLKEKHILKTIRQISVAERLNHEETMLRELARVSDGDLRLAINQQQFVNLFY